MLSECVLLATETRAPAGQCLEMGSFESRRRGVTFPTLVQIALGLVLLVGLCGCETPTRSVQPPYTVYRSPSLLMKPPRRVLLLPIATVAYDEGFSKQWYSILAGELRATKRFEVVTTNPHVPCVVQSMKRLDRGQFSESALVALRDYFRVDGILYVEQVDYYPYTPPRLSVVANLVDTTTGETIASVDGNWDAEDECVRVLMEQYAKHSDTPVRLNNTELVAIAPTLFGKFVAFQLADSFDRLLVPSKAPHVQLVSATGVAHDTGSNPQSHPIQDANSQPNTSLPDSMAPAPPGQSIVPTTAHPLPLVTPPTSDPTLHQASRIPSKPYQPAPIATLGR